MKREPIEDRWKSTLWENNPELLEYTSSLERKLKIAEEALEIAGEHMQKAVDEVEGCPFENCIHHDDGSTSCKYEDCIHYKAPETLSAISEDGEMENDRIIVCPFQDLLEECVYRKNGMCEIEIDAGNSDAACRSAIEYTRQEENDEV